MPSQLLLTGTIMAIAIGYAFYTMNKNRNAVANMGPVMQGWFQRTGYRYPDLPPEPIEPHVQRAVADAQQVTSNRVTRYVRNFHGIPIQFEQSYASRDGGFSMSSSWRAPASAPPRFPFHVADKSLDSMGKAVREAFSNTTRNWSAKHPHRVETGLPQIDGRFQVFAQDPNAVRSLFQQNAGLVALLTQCIEVDLWVDQHGAVFSDPSQKNINAALGGTVGSMAIGFDIGKRLDLSTPVHERMSELLALALRAAT